MSANQAPREDSYDVIVVGGGLGGLSAGAFLSKGGKKVLVVDRLDGPGGCAHAFRRGPYLFDPAVHVTVYASEGEILDVMLRVLGVRDRCNLTQLNPIYGAIYPDFRDHAPMGPEAFVAHYAQHFPEEADAIHRFVTVTMRVVYESQQLSPQISFAELDQAVAQFPTLFKYHSATLAEALDEFFTDPRLKAMVSATWPYYGLPPSRISYYTWAGMLTAFLEDGSFFSQGSFQQLANAYVAAIEENGGELVFGTRVRRINVQDGRVTGITLGDGQQIRSSAVVSNADARLTFEELIGPENVPEPYMRRLRRMRPSLSACVLYAATDLDLRQFEAPHETFIYKHWDHDETFQDILSGKPGGMWANVPTLTDPSLAPEGEHLIIFTALSPYDIGKPWEGERERYQDMLLVEVESLFPGVRDHLSYCETAVPTTLHQLTLSQQGATYGWANIPQQVGSRRLAPFTPIEGLVLSGHWTQPGSGAFRSMYSGVIAATILLGYDHSSDFLDALAAEVV